MCRVIDETTDIEPRGVASRLGACEGRASGPDHAQEQRGADDRELPKPTRARMATGEVRDSGHEAPAAQGRPTMTSVALMTATTLSPT